MRRAVACTLVAGLAVAGIGPLAAQVYEIGEAGVTSARSVSAASVWTREDVITPSARPDTDNLPVVDDATPAAAVTTVADAEAPAEFQAALRAAARRYDVSPFLLASLVWQESRWQPGALSKKGAIGLAQLMPATARSLAVDPRDAAANLSGAAHYLRQMLDMFDGDVERALAAYNAGPRRVLQANGVPAIRETRNYVSAIIDHLTLHDDTAQLGDRR